jgi:hypothetical protein
MNKNFNQYLDDLLSDIVLPTEDALREETKAKKVSLALSGKKHTEQTKRIWSEKKIGYKRNKDSVQKSNNGIAKTKWQQTLDRFSKEDILAAQKKHGNHQNNTMKELGISFTPYKKLCNHYGIELKKSNYEKTEFARTKQSEPILVWKCSKKEPYKKIGKPKKFNSVSECCRAFEPKLHKSNMLRNMQKGTPYREMFFEKINL